MNKDDTFPTRNNEKTKTHVLEFKFYLLKNFNSMCVN